MKARTKLQSGKLAVGYPSKRDEAVLDEGGSRCESVLYDFSEDGGATGDINFGRLLPNGAIVKAITADVQTAVTGATDPVLKAGSTSLTAATDLTALSGIATIALTDTDGIKLTADSELKLTIATAATAGKVRFYFEYLLPND
jgi:hypothetical protein